MRYFLLAVIAILYSCSPHETEPKIEQFTVSENLIVIDSTGSGFWNRTLEQLDSLTLNFTVTAKNTYKIAVNNLEEFHLLDIGSYSFSYALDEINLGDSILCSVGDTRYKDEFQYQRVEIENLYGAYIVNDPYYRYQWSLRSPDSIWAEEWGISPDAHISIEPVWKFTRGEGVKVAVIDYDLNAEHEDLKGQVIAGYTARTGEEWVSPDRFDNSHGTGVAGVIGAVGNNGTGMIGVAPEVELILADIRGASDAQIAEAFQFAKNMGAKVINCSWGTGRVSDIIVAAVKEMYDAGITVVFAADNAGENNDNEWIRDEAEIEWAIGVGSSDESNDRWNRSGYGSNLDLIAPGGNWSPGVLRTHNPGGLTSQYGVVTDHYAFQTGCSFSAPHVAGVAALMLAVNPVLTPTEIRQILIETTDKVGGADASYNAAGFDTYRMYGKLNAMNAVSRAINW